MSGRKHKRKGDTYERELAAHINNTVFQGAQVASRAPLSGGGRTFGGAGEADLSGVPLLHIEAKRTERYEPWKSMDQAERSIKARTSPDVPVVITRRNRMTTGSSLVTLRLDAFLAIYTSHLAASGHDPSRLGAAPPPPASDLPLFAGGFDFPAFPVPPQPQPPQDAASVIRPLSTKA